jgi:hypothetical protein
MADQAFPLSFPFVFPAHLVTCIRVLFEPSVAAFVFGLLATAWVDEFSERQAIPK